ncbi:hypothetical protein HYS54_01710 [Candidatus Micrarchaeota archaeon]|nr:hypothetical protein [Candidatus Micrarchaeota archaeon]
MEIEEAIAKLKAAEPKLPAVSQCVSDLMNDSQDAAQLVLGLDYFGKGKEAERERLSETLANIMFNCLRFTAKLDLSTARKLDEKLAAYKG